MRRLTPRVLLFATALAAGCTAPRPKAAVQLTPTPRSAEGVTGTMVRYSAFPSRFVAARHVDVWLPPGHADRSSQRYPVLYLHDGQNLFDPAESYTGIDWGVDEAMTRLIADGQIRPAIVVGVWNSPKRFNEYMPQKAVTDPATVADRTNEPLLSDNYLRFLVRELKPFIDDRYKTRPDRAHTFVMGASMGGLISLYALAEYPDVFGGAAGVSTHWPAGGGIVVDYLRTRLPAPGAHRLYFDFGTATLDSLYEPHQRRMDAALRARGYTEGADWTTRKFEGAEHNERAWRARVHEPLTFLLRP